MAAWRCDMPRAWLLTVGVADLITNDRDTDAQSYLWMDELDQDASDRPEYIRLDLTQLATTRMFWWDIYGV